jgi:nucleoside-triphosphatase
LTKPLALARVRRKVKKLLLTGAPGIGKTTLIKGIARTLEPFHPVGFYTEEIRKKGTRVGFQLVSLDGRMGVMSHVDIRGPFRVGKYGVDVEGFGRFLDSLPFRDPAISYVVIDEIGKMECQSSEFQQLVTAILDSERICVATIALRGTGFIESIKRRPDITLFTMDSDNRDTLASTLLQAIT